MNPITLLLGKLGGAALTTKVAVVGAVSAAAIGTAGATGALPVGDLLPTSDAVVSPVDGSAPNADLAVTGPTDGAGASGGSEVPAGPAAQDVQQDVAEPTDAPEALEATDEDAADESEPAEEDAAEEIEAADDQEQDAAEESDQDEPAEGSDVQDGAGDGADGSAQDGED